MLLGRESVEERLNGRNEARARAGAAFTSLKESKQEVILTSCYLTLLHDFGLCVLALRVVGGEGRQKRGNRERNRCGSEKRTNEFASSRNTILRVYARAICLCVCVCKEEAERC